MIQLRVQEEDCNAGVIFDNLTSENWPDEKYAIQLISDSVPLQNVQVIMFNFKKEESTHGKEPVPVEMEVCTNYRYALRHDPAFAQKRAQIKKDEERAQAQAD